MKQDGYLGLLFNMDDVSAFAFLTHTNQRLIVFVKTSAAIQESTIKNTFKQMLAIWRKIHLNPFSENVDPIKFSHLLSVTV